MADERAWYANIHGEKRGPISSAELKSLAAKGDIDRTSLVWCDGLADWVQAGTIKGLFVGPPPARQPIKQYEIEIDQNAMARRTKALRDIARIFTILGVVNFVVAILTKGLFSLLGALTIFGVIPVAVISQLMLRGYKTMRYCIVDDTLQISCKGFSRSVPLGSITDVQVSHVNGLNSLILQAGSLGKVILTDISDPAAVTKVLLGGRR